MQRWTVERVVHFAPGEFLKDGLAHFGFHARDGRYYAISHQEHHLAAVGADGRVEWTAGRGPQFDIAVDLEFPMYADALPDGTLVVSNFETAQLYRIDPAAQRAQLIVDGHAHGLADMGNCVVDDEGTIWVNEVRGCRVRRFTADGRLLETLGGARGFQPDEVGFDDARFGWIYDIRRGPDRTIYVLDSGNFAVRVIDVAARTVRLVAGTGTPGPETFGSDPSAPFDGPISLAVDETGTAYVGDRFNQVLRVVADGAVSTIAGRGDATVDAANDPSERDPLRLNLPAISSLDYADGRLFVPTDLADGSGDLAVLRRT